MIACFSYTVVEDPHIVVFISKRVCNGVFIVTEPGKTVTMHTMTKENWTTSLFLSFFRYYLLLHSPELEDKVIISHDALMSLEDPVMTVQDVVENFLVSCGLFLRHIRQCIPHSIVHLFTLILSLRDSCQKACEQNPRISYIFHRMIIVLIKLIYFSFIKQTHAKTLESLAST